MKKIKMFNKNILTIVFFMFIAILITGLSSVEAYALEDKIDISLKEPIVITQGEKITKQDIRNILCYEGFSLKSDYVNTITLEMPPHLSSSGYTDIFIEKWNTSSAELNTWRFLTEGEYTEGTLKVSFAIPSAYTGPPITIPFVIRYNYRPEITVPHIYVSEQDYNNMTREELYEHILNQVTVVDPEGRDDLEPEINGTYTFSPNKTTTVSISVDDYSNTTTVPAYVTIVAGEDTKPSKDFSNSKVKSISEEYYPYFRTDIMKTSNGYGAQKAEDGYLYFLNSEGDFLTTDGTATGKRYPVDACLESVIKKRNDTYYVVPISKWANNGTCISLLTTCFEESEEYIQSWTFDENDIYVIRKQLIADTLDENFYTNHYANGYCKDGTKKVNQTKKINTVATDLGTDGLQWYISNDTLYIVAKDVASEEYTYKMPDFTPTTSWNIKRSLQEHKYYVGHQGNADNPILLFEKYNPSGVTTAPWANYSFSRVKIDDKVSYIGAYSFAGMNCITEVVDIPKNCYKIGEAAFINCNRMKGDLQTKYVSIIEPFAFANCQELTGSLLLGTNAITDIGDYAFYNCGFTESLKLPPSLTKIGEYAFAHCKGFNGNLIVSANLTKLGKGAFMNCSGFDGDLNLNSNLTKIEPMTFAYCRGFGGGLSLPESITEIGDYAFYDCRSLLGNLSLPDELNTIGVCAFKDCCSLKSTLIINEALTNISPEAFANCVNITTIDNSKISPTLKIGAKAFSVDIGIVRTDLAKNAKNNVFCQYPFLGDGRELLNY